MSMNNLDVGFFHQWKAKHQNFNTKIQTSIIFEGTQMWQAEDNLLNANWPEPASQPERCTTD